MSDASEHVVEGYKYSNDGDPRDGEVVQIVSRVDDRRVLDDLGPAFFIRFENGEVGVALSRLLAPWFQL